MKSRTQVPFVDLAGLHARHEHQLYAAIRSTVESSDLVLGRTVRGFEASFAEYCETDYGIGCGNGTDALELVLEAAGIGAGDEVVTVSHTFGATVQAVLRSGATAVLVDVDPETLLLDESMLAAAITPKTAAIIVVHLYGTCVPMSEVLELARRRGLLLIEDAAQAHGARWQGRRAGSFGDAATFSFYPSKNLGALGDAGMVVTRDAGLAEKIKMIRDHGKSDKYTHGIVGRNSRLDGLQAAILSVKLEHLDHENALRRCAAQRYVDALHACGAEIRPVAVPVDSEPVHHLFVVQVNERNSVLHRLSRDGIGAGVHYPLPCHLQPAFRGGRVRVQGAMRITEAASTRVLSLPMHPYITDEQQRTVVATLANAVEP